MTGVLNFILTPSGVDITVQKQNFQLPMTFQKYTTVQKIEIVKIF